MVKIPSGEIRTKEILDWKGIHLFHFRGSSCSQKLRIYLNLKKINWTPHSINLAAGKNYSDWFLGINPKGLIPVLVDNGHVEIESNDILEYLEKKFPETPLSPHSSQTEINKLLKDAKAAQKEAKDFVEKAVRAFNATIRPLKILLGWCREDNKQSSGVPPRNPPDIPASVYSSQCGSVSATGGSPPVFS